jgi:predicted transcriptional regulator
MSTKTEVITLRLDKEMMEALQAIAKAEEIPVSYVVRRALKKGVSYSVLPKKDGDLTLPDWE